MVIYDDKESWLLTLYFPSGQPDDVKNAAHWSTPVTKVSWT